MIRVVVVDDSATVRNRLSQILARDPDVRVIGEAATGRRAIELCAALRPDVITLDLVLPELDGVAVTEQIMAGSPTPILIVSAASNRGDQIHPYQALEAGAVDVLEKPRDDDGDHDWDARFIAAVRMVARIKVITHPRARLASHRAAPAQVPLVVPADRTCSVVAIGASTGGPGALVQVLGALPPRFALPIVIVLHIDPAFAGSFAEWLAARTGRSVSLAVERERLDDAAGRVLLAPPNVHVAIEGGRLRSLASEPRNHCRPSVDVLFESLARDRGAQTLACLLTGMGRDGAEGMLAVRRAGGSTIAQDEATSVVYGMPREAVLRGAAERVLPLHDIGPAIAAAADRTRTR